MKHICRRIQLTRLGRDVTLNSAFYIIKEEHGLINTVCPLLTICHITLLKFHRQTVNGLVEAMVASCKLHPACCKLWPFQPSGLKIIKLNLLVYCVYHGLVPLLWRSLLGHWHYNLLRQSAVSIGPKAIDDANRLGNVSNKFQTLTKIDDQWVLVSVTKYNMRELPFTASRMWLCREV